MSTTLYIDLGHMSHRFLFAQQMDLKVFGYEILRGSLLNAIFKHISQFKPNRVVIGVDAKLNWRKKDFAFYKAQRLEQKEKNENIEWPKFQEFMNNFVQELKETLPFYVIEHDLLEADDIIAHLVRVESPDNKKVIVTSDTDYIQLLKYNNTKLYCPMKSMFRECETPNLELEKKIITGDKSDNIPSVRAGIGPVKALKLIESGNLEKLLEEKEADGTPGEFYRNYHRNKTLIDLNNTPQYLKTSLENLYNSYKPASGMGLFRYFTRNKMENFYSNMDYYRNLLKPLQEANS